MVRQHISTWLQIVLVISKDYTYIHIYLYSFLIGWALCEAGIQKRID